MFGDVDKRFKVISTYNIEKRIFETDSDKIDFIKYHTFVNLNNNLIKRDLLMKFKYSERIMQHDMLPYYIITHLSNKIIALEDDGETYYMYRKHSASLGKRSDNFLFFVLFLKDLYYYFKNKEYNLMKCKYNKKVFKFFIEKLFNSDNSFELKKYEKEFNEINLFYNDII